MHTQEGFSSSWRKATLTVRKERSNNLYERKAYTSYRKENHNSLHTCQASAMENTRNMGSGGLGEEGGRVSKRGGWWAGTSLGVNPWR